MTTITSERIMTSAKALIDFVNRGPSPYHVVNTCRNSLQSAGYIELSEKEAWDLKVGGKYFMTRNQSSLIAFAVGEQYKTGNGFSIIGAHTDSPCLKLKPFSKKHKCDYLSVGVQCYGGGIWNTWFDRDLTVAGRVLVKNKENVIKHHLVYINKPILRIPHLCIHLQREMNEKLVINKEAHVLPFIATKVFDCLNRNRKDSETAKEDENTEDKTKGDEASKHHPVLVDVICKELNCKAEDLLDFDLVLADTQPAVIGGAYDEFILAPRLDNLFNSYCALQALINSTNDGLVDERNIRMINLYDNEEVGSQSAQGAASMLTELIMKRICESLNSSFERSIANSYLLSADQAHAVHPNYAEKHEADHKPKFHGGPVIKFNANQKYATTAITASILRVIAKKCGVPLQDVVVRNDSACGSTIGPILSAKLGIRTLDIGGPMLAMHSIREVCCTSGVEQSVVLFKAFFQGFPNVDASLQVE